MNRRIAIVGAPSRIQQLDAPEAMAYLEAGRAKGKVVVSLR
jgi:hypothetical protein